MNTEIISSENLIFRPMVREVTDLVLKWRNSDAVRRNFLYRKEITREQHLLRFDQKIETGEIIQFVIIEKKNKRPIGSVYLRDIDKNKKSAEYGIFIGEDSARGKGYGSETACRIVRFFFDDMKYELLYLRVLEDNEAAIRSYRSAGFQFADKDAVNGSCEDSRVLFMMIKRQVEAEAKI